ncbi:RAN GTPase-activating protein 1 [Diplonema papillatum]|nr:RAN GTPase-activating protein 1 [Diplonema papillatum]
MDQLLAELIERSSNTTVQLLRSELRATEVVRERIEEHAKSVPAEVDSFDLSTGGGDGVVQALGRAMQDGRWAYVANVSPEHDGLLRKISLLAFTANAREVHQRYRLWASTLTKHTEFEPPPVHGGASLPRVLLHLCNAPQSLLGDMDDMHLVDKHQPSTKQYDAESCDASMADTVERLVEDDPSLTSLTHDPSSTISGAAFFEHLPDALRYNSSLTALHLHGCCIGETGAERLGQALRYNKGITHIDLTKNQLSNEAVASLCAGLRENRGLKSLVLAQNPGIASAGLAALSGALPASAVEHLSLELNNSLKSECGWTRGATKSFAECIPISSLTSLDLGACDLSAHSVMTLVAALDGSESLTSLTLSGNRIGDGAAVVLARSLGDQKNAVAHLFLDGCSLTARAFVAFGAALKRNSTLRTLSLSRSLPMSVRPCRNLKLDAEEDEQPTASVPPVPSEPSPEDCPEFIYGTGETQLGVHTLAAGLASNTSLETLRVAKCQLGPAQMQSLSKALLESNDTLRSLDLTGNAAIGDKGSHSLQQALQGGFEAEAERCSLRELDVSETEPLVAERVILALSKALLRHVYLRHTQFDDGMALTLRDSLINNPAVALCVLDLSHNSMHEEAMKRMGEILLRHCSIEELYLRDNLKFAWTDTYLPLRPNCSADGLSRFADDGVGVVADLFDALRKLPAASRLRHVCLRDNTITDACVKYLVKCFVGVPRAREAAARLCIDVRGNGITGAVLPAIDGVSQETAVDIVTDAHAPL